MTRHRGVTKRADRVTRGFEPADPGIRTRAYTVSSENAPDRYILFSAALQSGAASRAGQTSLRAFCQRGYDGDLLGDRPTDC